MKLFFDTETTGTPKSRNAPAKDIEAWSTARLVQLGWIVYMNDEPISRNEYIIMPEDFTIPEDASRIHGITQERAMNEGLILKSVLTAFAYDLNMCDEVIGHNVDFDLGVVGSEFYRAFGRNPLEDVKHTCTMKSSIYFCNLPGKYGKPKFPKLQELYFKLFDQPLAQTHTALDDIENTATCYFEMVQRGLIKNEVTP